MSNIVPRPFHRILRAEPLSVRRTLTDLRRAFAGDCGEDVLGRLELVLAEALNNVVEHAAPPGPVVDEGAGASPRARPVHLVVRWTPAGLTCVITDDGVLLPCDCLRPRALPPRDAELAEGGFGWYLIQGLVSELSYSRRSGRNHLAFTIPAEEHRTEDA